MPMLLLSGCEPFVEMIFGNVSFSIKSSLRSFTLLSGFMYLSQCQEPTVLGGACKNILITLKKDKGELLGQRKYFNAYHQYILNTTTVINCNSVFLIEEVAHEGSSAFRARESHNVVLAPFTVFLPQIYLLL